MDGTFHRFPNLPWELRDMIWNFALRPAVPGVQIFKIYNPETDDGVDENIDVFDPKSSLRLAAPQSENYSSTDITKNRDNLSTYLIDGGLWTACKESSLVMKRNSNYRKWKSLFQDSNHSYAEMIEEGMDMPETGYFTRHKGDAYFFTVFPHKDLFIFQPQNLETTDWFKFCWKADLGSPHRGFAGIQNMALEYNPEWGYEIAESIIDMAVGSAEAVPGVNIWIVDYSLRRRDSAAVGHKNVAFYLKGQRLIPVCLYYEGDWIEVEEVNGAYVERASTRAWRNSIHLVSHAYQELQDRYETGVTRPPVVSIGLLAYDCAL